MAFNVPAQKGQTSFPFIMPWPEPMGWFRWATMSTESREPWWFQWTPLGLSGEIHPHPPEFYHSGIWPQNVTNFQVFWKYYILGNLLWWLVPGSIKAHRASSLSLSYTYFFKGTANVSETRIFCLWQIVLNSDFSGRGDVFTTSHLISQKDYQKYLVLP